MGAAGAALCPDGEDLDPFRQLELGRRRVFPREVQVIAAAVAGVAFVADPAEGRHRTILLWLRPEGEAGDPAPGRVAFAVAVDRNDVDGEAVVVVGVLDGTAVTADVFAIWQRPGVTVGDVNREVLGNPDEVGHDAAVDHVAFFVRDRGRNRHDPAGRRGDPGRDRAGARGRRPEPAE